MNAINLKHKYIKLKYNAFKKIKNTFCYNTSVSFKGNISSQMTLDENGIFVRTKNNYLKCF